MFYRLIVQDMMYKNMYKLIRDDLRMEKVHRDAEVVGGSYGGWNSPEWKDFPDDWYAQQKAKAVASGEYDKHKFITYRRDSDSGELERGY